MVRGRFGRIKRSVASTLAAVFTLALPWAFAGVPTAHAIEEAKALPSASSAPAKSETEKAKPEADKKTARVHKKGHHKKPRKRLADKGAKTDGRHDKDVVDAKADHDEPTMPAKHEPKKVLDKPAPAKGSEKPGKGKPHAKANEEPAHSKSETVTASVKTEAAKPKEPAHAKKTEVPGKRGKKAKSTMPGGKRRTSKKDEPEKPPCFAPAISIDRNGLEGETFSLVDCKGGVLEDAREKLSVLARPWGSPRPVLASRKKATKAELRVEKSKAKTEKPGTPDGKPAPETATEVSEAEIAPNVRLLDAGLLSRVETISKHFGNKPISLVSGYRPKSKGSLHQSARALDMRVTGVSNEELVAFCKTLEDTGCGYYPNSSFVHVDVRNKGTGSVSWIDASGPGETPRYVTQWPPPPDEKADEKATATATSDEEEPKASPAAAKTAVASASNGAAGQTIEAAKPADAPKEAAKEAAPKPGVAKEADFKDKGDTGSCSPVKEAKESAPAGPTPKQPAAPLSKP